MNRFLPFVIFAALAVLLAFFLLAQQQRLQTSGADMKQTALPALNLKPLEGNAAWQQEKLKGQLTLLNFFASWCTPCAAEMPELVALKKQFPQLHMVGVVWNDDPTATHKFLKEHGNPFEAIWLDPNGSSTMALGIRGIPETMIVDGAGNIRYRLGAPITQGLREGEIAARMQQLLAEMEGK